MNLFGVYVYEFVFIYQAVSYILCLCFTTTRFQCELSIEHFKHFGHLGCVWDAIIIFGLKLNLTT